MAISATTLDGAYLLKQLQGTNTNINEPETGNIVNDHVIANAPLIEVKNGATLTLIGGTGFETHLQNNHNSTTDGGAIKIDAGGTVKMNNSAHIKDNYVATGHGGGVYLTEGGTLLLSDIVHIDNNHRVEQQNNQSVNVPENVYLPTYNSYVTIGTQNPTDNYGALDDSQTPNPNRAHVGVTKADVVTAWTNPDSTSDSYYTPVAYAEDGMNHLGNLLGSGILFDDGDLYAPEKYEPVDPENKLFFVKTWANVVHSQPSGFDASQINTADELAWAISLVNGLNNQTAATSSTFTLTGDIDMSDYIWVPIGTATNAYAGTFNGNGYTVSGLHSSLNSDNMGLFGVTNGATINNLQINTTFDGGIVKNLGTIAGTMQGGALNNCRVSGSLVGKAGTETIGGLVGTATGTDILNGISTAAINTESVEASCKTGGLAGVLNTASNTGSLKNSFAHFTLTQDANSSVYTGGLIGRNEGTVDNCYALLRSGSVTNSNYGNLACQNTGTIDYAYAATTPYSVEGSVGSHCGTFNEVVRPYGYGPDGMGNKVGSDNLVDLLNTRAASNSTYSKWLRTSASPINGDYPILRYDNLNPRYTTVASPDNVMLDYGTDFSTKIRKYNDLDNGGTILVYGNSTISTINEKDVTIYVDENASLLQDVNGNLQNVYVGVTMGNKYSWHMFASPLKDAPVGINYLQEGQTELTEYGFGPEVDNNIFFEWNTEDGYFPTNTPLGSFDLYTYFEPQYHWINLKRNSISHWHEDGNHDNIDYLGNGVDSGNETTLIPGKGYLAAIDQKTYLQSHGTLQNGEFTIGVTNTTALDGTSYENLKGFNLLGNPYQSYLDFNEFATTNTSLTSYTILDGSKNAYLSYTQGTSINADVASRYINPHQGFFVVAPEDGTATFNNGMRTHNTDANTHFRGGDERPAYPLINLYATDASGKNEVLVVEANRPELGGAIRSRAQRHADARFFAHFEGDDYSILFTPEGVHEVPVYFDVMSSGRFTISWNTQNEGFTYVHLVDNLTGKDIDCLTENQYSFDADRSDYEARFKLVFYVSDDATMENDEPFAFYNGSAWFVKNEGNAIIQVIDVLGRIVGSTSLHGDGEIYCVPDVPAVYTLRKIKGNEVKTQKIVVR